MDTFRVTDNDYFNRDYLVSLHLESSSKKDPQTIKKMASLTSLETLLSKLIRREDLTEDEASAATKLIASGEADPHQIAAFLVLLAAKGETAEEIFGMANVMRGHTTRIPLNPS